MSPDEGICLQCKKFSKGKFYHYYLGKQLGTASSTKQVFMGSETTTTTEYEILGMHHGFICNECRDNSKKRVLKNYKFLLYSTAILASLFLLLFWMKSVYLYSLLINVLFYLSIISLAISIFFLSLWRILYKKNDNEAGESSVIYYKKKEDPNYVYFTQKQRSSLRSRSRF
jgi:hypothetical protein